MSKKDIVTKEYMRDPSIFADMFNFYLYNGEQVIDPKQLRELDTTSMVQPFGIDGKSSLVQRYRDGLKAVVAMTDEHRTYLILGNEDQSDISYSMVIRNMLYDAMSYTAQAEDAAKAHKLSGDVSSSSGEFLSGFFKTDRLVPVITLTIYFGADEWDAPMSLHEMLDEHDSRLDKFIPDYRLNLITPLDIADEDIHRFHTDLSAVMQFIKYSKDKDKLYELVRSDDSFSDMDARTANMLNIVTGAGLELDTGKERIDMCKAIEDMRNDSIALGRSEGIALGRSEGIALGMINTLASLVRDGMITLAEAAKRADMSVSEFSEKAGIST